MQTLRILLLLRFAERHMVEKLAAVSAWSTRAWPDYAVTVIDSGEAFKATRHMHSGRMQSWINHAATGQVSDGPAFHAFVVLDDLVGHATGAIVAAGLRSGRHTYFLDFPTVAAAQCEGFTGCPFDFTGESAVHAITGVTPVAGGAGRHDWRLVWA